jgi:hypothetical protein
LKDTKQHPKARYTQRMMKGPERWLRLSMGISLFAVYYVVLLVHLISGVAIEETGVFGDR